MVTDKQKAYWKSLKGKISWNKGRKETRPEVLKRQSESHIGQKAWNEGMGKPKILSGIDTKFKKGQDSPRLNKGKGYLDNQGYKANNVNRKKVLEHRKIWCSQKTNIPYIPSNMVIHHCDGNKLNNNSSNLILIENAQHSQLHWDLRKLGV